MCERDYMTRVLHFTQSSGLGGVTDLSLDLIKYSKDFQFVVANYCDDERTEVEFRELGVEYHKEISFDGLREIIKTVDIAHAQPGANAKCDSLDIALDLGIPAIATVGTAGPIHRDYEGLVTVVAGSQSLLDKQPAGARLIYHGVDIDRLQCGDKKLAKEHWGLDPDKLVVGWMGRYIAFKCPGTTIGIAKRVQEADPSVQFVMFGDKDGYEPAVELAKEIGAEVVFAGGTREKALAYGAMDVGLFPTFGEAFGRVAAEMLGAEVPMICSQCPTNVEIAGPFAIYLPAPNYWNDNHKADYHCQTWAYSILALLECEQPRLDMARAGKQRALDLFDAKVMARKYNDLYKELA